MKEFLETSAFFPVIAGVVFYIIGDLLRRRLRLSALNPLLVSIVLTALTILILDIDVGAYRSGADFMSYLLTPATVCLAIPLHRQLHVLRGNTAAIICGILAGTAASLGCIVALALAFGLSEGEIVTFLPKSVTTAIGIGISEELGGNVSLTAAAIILTGVLGNVIAVPMLKLFRITEPVAKGVALGTSTHAIGTTKALELGETEGAVSGLSLVVAGIITVIAAPVVAALW